MAKETPRVKVYEAWTAVADGNRIEISAGSDLQQGSARVRSSNGEKVYEITWRDGGTVFTSTDPASYWQGYAGYPIVCVLMTLGRIYVDMDVARRFAGINWTDLNKRFKRDYEEAVSWIESERGIDRDRAAEAAERVIATLRDLNLTIKRK